MKKEHFYIIALIVCFFFRETQNFDPPKKMTVLLTPIVFFVCEKVSPIFLKLWILIEGHET